MKNYLICFLFFTTVVFSQNYQYSLEEGKIPPPVVLPTGVNNQQGEIEYFKAYLLPLSQKADLQTALDTYGAVRLEKGDYSGVAVVMHSNQRLYGHPSTNEITSITVAAGSTNVYVESIKQALNSALYITFQSGSPITNCTFKTLKYAIISATNVRLEGNTFIDVIGTINFDCSASGYFRNNRIIKHISHGNVEMLVIKGNRTTPSYGNVNIHSNYLGSQGESTNIDNLESATFIGTDAETYWGLSREIFYINNVDKLKLIIVNGGINYESGFGFSNVDATELYAMQMYGGSSTPTKISARTNLLNFSNDMGFARTATPVTGFYANFYNQQVDRYFVPYFNYDGITYNSTITNPTIVTKLTNSILGTQYTPWARPSSESIPDPLGANWKTERTGKPDSTAYIQNLINTSGVADLPEGVFYISSTLNIPIGAGKGIVGKGTGKTVICGLTEDFPLISVTSGTFGNIDLANLTLQGGRVGLYVSNHSMMMSFQSLNYVSFREQTAGIEVYDVFGVDNCFFSNLAFVNCDKGIYNHPFDGVVDHGDVSGSTYMDKNVFYNCKFYNCNTSMFLHSSRASNLNAWVNCKFDGGTTAGYIQADTTIFANCDFTNFTGEYTLESNGLNLISCNFYNNTSSRANIRSITNYIEGCKFLDNIPLGYAVPNNPTQNFVYNSIITGNAIVEPEPYRSTYSLFVNSQLLSNPTFNKLLVRGVTNTPTVFIDAAPNPYPQFLVTQ